MLIQCLCNILLDIPTPQILQLLQILFGRTFLNIKLHLIPLSGLYARHHKGLSLAGQREIKERVEYLVSDGRLLG